ncbi:hypothetical protein J7E83_02350 [Arthrobacter sp. ISL-48]|uniref:hypothetical protein n=1 Tax=Arthrobacter sp. ISL-48 TaxID=2819110 RepID=UPI001BE7FDEE|nr:hypothetical protein [Arthrobacter sp. ISL-48]MBT2530979.1 hypothetical protein [Arthrobacter sp. ISL-48]
MGPAQGRNGRPETGDHMIVALEDIGAAVRSAREELKQDQPVATVTWRRAGTLVNVAWVVFDLLILSVIVRAALYKGPTPKG